MHALKPQHASLLQATLQTIDTTRDKKKKIENGVETAKQKKERKKKQRI